jgi:hypothetical protein
MVGKKPLLDYFINPLFTLYLICNMACTLDHHLQHFEDIQGSLSI